MDNDLILVGFGKHDLNDMLQWVGTDKEEDLLLAHRNWPPRYRRIGACSQEQILTCKKYVDFLVKVVKELEQ